MTGREALKRGDKVTIYQDPITELRPEGTARLIRKLGHDDGGSFTLERWIVRFEGDGYDFERSIRVGGAVT